jgi:16S rRNA (guanine527-N7)-methyltransferase
MFHVKHEGWGPDELSPGQWDMLSRYEVLLLDRAVPRGMVASSSSEDLRNRHVLDSLRAVPHVDAHARFGCDLGSGAGLPGIPLAIALPDLELTLAESRRARAAFLELVLDELGLQNARVFPGRVEQLSADFDVCFARAYANPERAWAGAERLLRPRGNLLYWAGASFDPDSAPPGAHVRIVEAPLENRGPIVIMTRQ